MDILLRFPTQTLRGKQTELQSPETLRDQILIIAATIGLA